MGERRGRSRSPAVRSGQGGGGEAREGDWTCPRCRCNNFARRVECFKCQTERKMDWICKRCDFENFAKRVRCFSCDAPKNTPVFSAAARDPYDDPYYDYPPPPRGRPLPPPPRRRELPPRDYARDYPPPPRQRQPPPRDYPGPLRTAYPARDRFPVPAGDEWECEQCGTFNYAHRERCFTCPTSRPRAAVRGRARSRTPEPVDSGDWVCRDCHTNNFMKKEACFGCKKAKSQVTRRPMIKRGERVMECKDWACKECDMVNFARRTECFKCKKPRSAIEKEKGEFRLGDWRCRDCLCKNFAKRTECFKCKVARAECEVNYDSNGHVVCVGDWTCLECNENNFAKRVECFSCAKARPGYGEHAAGSTETAELKGEGALGSSEYDEEAVQSESVSPECDNDVVKMESELSTDVVNHNFGDGEGTDVTAKDVHDVVMAVE